MGISHYSLTIIENNKLIRTSNRKTGLIIRKRLNLDPGIKRSHVPRSINTFSEILKKHLASVVVLLLISTLTVALGAYCF